MLCNLRNAVVGLALTLSAPVLALPAALTINGVCEFRTCAPLEILQPGQSAKGVVSVGYVFGNGDKYQVSGAYSVSNSVLSGTSLSFNPSAVYTGNVLDPSAASKADTLTMSFLQLYQVPSLAFPDASGGWNLMNQSANTANSSTPTSTYQSQWSAGPQSNSDASYSPTTLPSDFTFVYSFSAGSLPSSSIGTIVPAVPEPRSVMLILAGGIAFGCRRLFRRRAYSA